MLSLSLVLFNLLYSGEEQNPTVGIPEGIVLIFQVVTILIFTLQNVNKKTEGLTCAETLQHTLILQNACAATLELVGVMLERKGKPGPDLESSDRITPEVGHLLKKKDFAMCLWV